MDNKEYAASLREIADWYEANPTVPPANLTISNYSVNTKEDAVRVTRALGSCRKIYSDEIFKITKQVGIVTHEFVFMRHEVCERKVIGLEEVPERIIAAHSKEIVKWECHPVLEPSPPIESTALLIEPTALEAF